MNNPISINDLNIRYNFNLTILRLEEILAFCEISFQSCYSQIENEYEIFKHFSYEIVLSGNLVVYELIKKANYLAVSYISIRLSFDDFDKILKLKEFL